MDKFWLKKKNSSVAKGIKRRLRIILCCWLGLLSIISMLILPKSVYKIDRILIKILIAISQVDLKHYILKTRKLKSKKCFKKKYSEG